MKKILSCVLILLVGCVLILLIGCASGGIRRPILVSTLTAGAVLEAFKNEEPPLVCGRATAPPPPLCIPLATHHIISANLEEANALEIEVLQALEVLPKGSMETQHIIALTSRIGVLVNHIMTLIPDGSPQKVALAQKLAVR